MRLARVFIGVSGAVAGSVSGERQEGQGTDSIHVNEGLIHVMRVNSKSGEAERRWWVTAGRAMEAE